MSITSGKTFQIVDNDGELVPDFKTHLQNFNMENVQKNYYTVGIIGGQSSGKSTLLNSLFGTNFMVMDPKKRCQTTKGIWCNHTGSENFLVMDIEGADSVDRWENKTAFERSTALFGLVISNVLIINIWTTDVNRFSAANYDIIKCIFELNIKLFNTDQPKVIIFTIRDFCKEREDINWIKESITGHLKKLWDEISKPAKFLNTKPEDFFTIRFEPISNYWDRREEFNSDVKALACRFTDANDKDYYFNHINAELNLPFTDLGSFIERIWKSIKENKELNIPGEKIVVSTFRCGEEKANAIELAQQDLNALNLEVKNGNYTADLGKKMKDIMSKSVRYYQTETQGYDEEVTGDKKNELEREMKGQFRIIENTQIQTSIDDCVTEFKSGIKKLRGFENLKEVVDAAKLEKSKITESYVNKLKETKFEFNEDKYKEEESYNSFVESISHETNLFIRNQVDLVYNRMQNEQTKAMDTFIGNIFKDIKPGWWADFLKSYQIRLDNTCKQIDNLATNSEELQGIFSDELNDQKKKQFFFNLRDHFLRKFSRFNNILIDKFKRVFEKTNNGIRMKEFKLINDEDIQKDFDKWKEYMLKIFDEGVEAEFPGFMGEEPRKLMKIEDEQN